MMRHGRHAANMHTWSLILCLLVLALPVPAFSQTTATYQHIGGKELSIRIEVGSPPPSSLILVQKLPPGTGIVYADPPAEKIDQAGGEAKWLFRQLQSGTITVSFSLDREISPAEISGQIRFKPVQGQGMKNLPVSKP